MDDTTNEVCGVEVWVLMDGEGNYVCCEDRDGLKDRYEEIVGELDGGPTRVLKLSVAVPYPKPVELAGAVGAEPAAGELKVA
jgi:hypothetical protein